MVQVLVNLIDNALKFSYSNSQVHIRIYSEKTELIFTVSDNGIGFEQKDCELLFEKFTKMNKVGTSNEPTMGIGLYLCRKTIEKHHGKLIAKSDGKNKGATFSVIFSS